MAKQERALLTGFFTETNTYVSPGTMASFIPTRGQDIIEQNRGNNTNFGAYIDYCDKNNVEMIGAVSWMGNPAGLLDIADYLTMRAEMMDKAKEAVKSGPIDYLMLNFHEAACVQGVPDAELDIVTGPKEICGDGARVLALATDLHGKCSDGFVKACDLISVVHKYPHIDYYERAAAAQGGLGQAGH